MFSRKNFVIKMLNLTSIYLHFTSNKKIRVSTFPTKEAPFPILQSRELASTACVLNESSKPLSFE